jgi:hypothetical protein
VAMRFSEDWKSGLYSWEDSSSWENWEAVCVAEEGCHWE